MSEVFGRVLDSTDRAVGGGSAAALSAAMAAGLAGMVARLSVGRDLALGDARYEVLVAEADELSAALLAGAREDAEVYALVSAAHRAHPNGEGEAEARRTAIDEALLAAARVPLENACRALRVLELSTELSGRSNPVAASDLAVARLLADAGVSGCLANVAANLGALHDSARAAGVRHEAESVRIAHARAGAPLKERT